MITRDYCYMDGCPYEACKESAATPWQLAMKEFTFTLHIPQRVTIHAASYGDAVDQAMKDYPGSAIIEGND